MLAVMNYMHLLFPFLISFTKNTHSIRCFQFSCIQSYDIILCVQLILFHQSEQSENNTNTFRALSYGYKQNITYRIAFVMSIIVVSDCKVVWRQIYRKTYKTNNSPFSHYFDTIHEVLIQQPMCGLCGSQTMKQKHKIPSDIKVCYTTTGTLPHTTTILTPASHLYFWSWLSIHLSSFFSTFPM